MKQNTLVWLAVIALALFLSPGLMQTAFAQWSNDPTVNTPVATLSSTQESPQLCEDGTGGTIIAWQDNRSGNRDIYAQRLNAAGIPQWSTDGVAICTASNDQDSPQLVSDGSGGAIITWVDNRNSNTDIYAQRVNSSGLVQWTTNGVAICTVPAGQTLVQLVSDSAGGAITAWADYRNWSHDDVYAQRVNSSGVVQWATDGVAICTATNTQDYPQLVSDGSGGAITTWRDVRNGSTFDIYAQRVNSSGVVQWATDGVAMCTAAYDQTSPQLTSDGADGAIITWEDTRNSWISDIYAQRVNSSGVAQWATNGVGICTASSYQRSPELTSDGSGGAIITWRDERGSTWDIYAQRVNSSGAVQWTTNGVAICPAAGNQSEPQLTGDGLGGAIITWSDDQGYPNIDIYAQCVNSSGVVQWATNGVATCTAANEQYSPQLASDGAGGAIITWRDWRSGNVDIYAQHVCGNGTLPVQLSSFHARRLSSLRVLLNWQTVSEVNNYGFYVQRCLQSVQQWEDLPSSFVPGHGTTNEPQNYSLTDNTAPTADLQYRLKQIDLDGTIHYSEPISVSSLTSIKEVAPIEFALEQNYPNPFNPSTTVRYQIPEVSHVSLRVYDMLGREVATLVDEVRDAGFYEAVFDASSLASGMYIYRLQAKERSQVRKLLLLK